MSKLQAMTRKIHLVTATVALSILSAASPVSAETKAPAVFKCKPGETYYMNVMVSGVEYWFPVYEMMKQAAQSMGCKTVYTGTPEYDVNKQLASFEQILAKKPAGILLHQ